MSFSQENRWRTTDQAGSATLVFYSDEASFDAATTALATQTFASANVPADGLSVTNSGLNSNTNDGVFAPGDILPGVNFTSTMLNGGEIAATGVGLNGYTNNAIFGNFFASPLSANFGPGVTAVSANLLSFVNESTITGSVYSETSILLGTFSVPNVPESGSGLFFGVISTGGEQIGAVTFEPGDLTVGVDRVQFGQAFSSVPEPPSIALFGIAGSAALTFGLRRSQRAARV